MTTIEPQAIGSPPGAFQIALDMLKSAGSKRVLDCPAGQGVFTRMLLRDGYDVTPTDIYPEGFKLSEIDCEFCDLNDRLPYETDQFDALTCLNGLQRVWARGRAVAEMARVVKPGGRVLISFPNNSDIRRRMLFMMTGSVTWNVIGPPHVARPEAENPAAWFRYPMTLANVLSATESVGLKTLAIKSTHYTTGAMLLSPFALAPILCSLLAPASRKKQFYLRESSTMDALLGAFLVVIAEKPG